jgi:hypothetical protein
MAPGETFIPREERDKENDLMSSCLCPPTYVPIANRTCHNGGNIESVIFYLSASSLKVEPILSSDFSESLPIRREVISSSQTCHS